MTYREYFEKCDEFEKAVIAVNLVRNHPYLERLTPVARKRAINEILDTEMPKSEERQ